jgi:hypothetical protein
VTSIIIKELGEFQNDANASFWFAVFPALPL